MSHHYASPLPTQLIIMNSLDAEKINSTNHVKFRFDSQITAPRGHTILVGIASLVIPLSFKIISSHNNTLIVNGVTYTITQGSPDATELATELTSTLPDITVTYDENSNKFKFTSSSNISISSDSTSLTLLGLSKKHHTGTTIVSDYVIDLAGPRVLHLHCPSLNSQSMDSRTMNFNDVLDVIPVNQPHFSMLSYRGWELFQIQETTIKSLEFFFTDGLGQLADFQGAQWSLNLSVSIIPTPEAVIAKNLLLRQKDGVPTQPEERRKEDKPHTIESSKDNRPRTKKDRKRRRKRGQDAR